MLLSVSSSFVSKIDNRFRGSQNKNLNYIFSNNISDFNAFLNFRNDCTAIGRLAGQEGTDVYCHRQCLRYPSNCPKDECKCVEKIDPKDPSIVLDRSTINIEKDFVTNYTNQNGHKVEEFEDHGDKYKVISVN